VSGGLFDRLQGELAAREQSPGLRMSDLLTLPEPQCSLLNWMIRQVQVGLGEVAAFLHRDEEGARTVLAELRDQGFVREIEMRGVTTYRVRLAPKRGRTMPANLWQALDDKVETDGEAPR
jgi:hypothetical protein